MENFIKTEDEQEKTEGRIQADCFEWFNNSFPELRGLMYHVPNGEKRDKVTANKLKAMGVVAGVPDLEFHFWRRTFFLECKTPTGTTSKEQKKVQGILFEHGFRVFTFTSLEQFQTIVLAIIEDKSVQYGFGMERKDYDYRNGVFSFLFDLVQGEVKVFTDMVANENLDKFKGILFEFMSEGYDKVNGFELLLTPDYLGFYKNDLEQPTEVYYKGKKEIDLPNE